MSEASEAGSRASFRDPGGSVVFVDDRLLRMIRAEGEPDFRSFLASEVATRLVAAGKLVRTSILPEAESALASAHEAVLVVEHERVPFPSYPYEWPAEMLHAAGELTLELSEQALAEGFGLKDATPYNVLFRGTRPIFVDWLSFETRDPGDPIWLAQGQFARTFLLPLLAAQRFGTPPAQIFLTQRDGLRPEDLYPLFGALGRLRPAVLRLVSLPTWLRGRAESDPGTYRKRSTDPEKARFIVSYLLRRTRKQLSRLQPGSGESSTWSGYMAEDAKPAHYGDEGFRAKQGFVERALEEIAPGRVLDVGCNTGHFSFLAARAGASVVAVDADPSVVGRVWREARETELDVLPLVVDLTRPSPAVGWLYQECPSFLDRARGHFDLVLMLAVIHHMMVGERVPMREIAALSAELTRDAVVVEYVGPSDPMFRRIARGREALHADLNPAAFEDAWSTHFEIVRSEPLAGADRRMYLMRRRRREP